MRLLYRELCSICADAEQSGDLCAPAIFLWAVGDRLAGLRELLRTGASAAGHRKLDEPQVRQLTAGPDQQCCMRHVQ